MMTWKVKTASEQDAPVIHKLIEYRFLAVSLQRVDGNGGILKDSCAKRSRTSRFSSARFSQM
ncbi:hypothetical protein [Bacillus sp. NSP9.1]|uniref:hypothetical protein n=1 Tax=Bacillus sp. NSP9.1 TaxID=1071078 RepID=UPI0004081BE2|nr:hypothetical protein [Bacillus sp. NSP9.1]QHZ46061.1 hypothetical protein M654_007065 [Bacillus sp. NSP9.1]